MQESLFREQDNTRLPDKIVKIEIGGAALSKDQQTFNRLVKRISNLRSQLKDDSEKLDILSKEYYTEVIPRGMELSSLKIEFSHLLDEKRQAIKLSNILNYKLDELISEFLDDALSLKEPDERTEQLYKKYGSKSYNEFSQDVESEAKHLFCDMVYEQFGVNIDPSELTDNHDYEKIQADLEAQLNKNGATKQNSRPRTKKQQEKDLIGLRKKELKSKTLRGIYMSLVKLLHPDRELDGELKKEKEEMMKQVTIAYNNRDMMSLLQLEMQYVTAHENSITDMDTNSLAVYLQLLKDQVKDLEAEREIFFLQPAYLLVSEFWQESLPLAIDEIKDHASRYQKLNNSIRADIEEIEKSSRTYALVRDCIGKYYGTPMSAW